MKRRPCPDLRPHREEIGKYLLAKTIVVPDGCWKWQGHTNSLGYAEGSFQNRTWIMTRLIYCATQGGFDKNLDVCHTCDNPGCVNPLHLWLGSRSDNIKDSVKKGRHFLATITHCKRGHPLSGDNLYVAPPHKHRPPKRSCIICQRAAGRIRAGWPEELAFSLPVQPLGYKPDGLGADWHPKTKRGPKTHCVNGHPLSGDNLYVVPSDGRRQCRACKLAVIHRIAAERAGHSASGGT